MAKHKTIIEPELTLVVSLRQNHARALRRVVEEMVSLTTARMLKAKTRYAEQLVTEQAVALGALRSALTQALGIPPRREED